MSTSYYGVAANSGDAFTTAGGLTPTGGGSALSNTTGTQTFNFNGFYLKLPWAGGSVSASGTLQPPGFHGWLYASTALEGTTIPTGTWAFLCTLVSSDTPATGDLTVRFYRFNDAGASATLVATATVSAVTIATGAGTAITASATGVASVTFATGEKLYIEVDWHQTSGGSATNTIAYRAASTANGVPGASGGVEVQVPSAGGGNVNGAVTFRGTLPLIVSDQATGAVTLRGTLGTQVGPGLVKPPTPTIPPPVMPLISRGVPAYSNGDGTYPASNANDALYSTRWRSVTVPTPQAPIWLAYDLSSVPAVQRGIIVVNLLNEIGNYRPVLDGGTGQIESLFQDYELDGNASAGGTGTPPASGWVTLASVTGNDYPTRQHILDFAGYNWLRLLVTVASNDSSNNDVIAQMDVHDGHLGVADRWLLLGDSITLEGMTHASVTLGEWGPAVPGALCQVANRDTFGTYFPATIEAGDGGMTMAWAAQHITELLNGFAGGFVSLAFGTNDCNQTFQFTAGDANVTAYYTNLLACIDAAAALNNKVVWPLVPYGSNNGGDLGYNANLCNQYVLAHLPTDRPNVLIGPDLWTFFQANPGLLRDGIHPTYTEVNGAADGYEQVHSLWGAWMEAAVYQVSPPTAAAVVSDAALAVAVIGDS